MGELSLRADFLAALGSATSRRAAEAGLAGAGRRQSGRPARAGGAGPRSSRGLGPRPSAASWPGAGAGVTPRVPRPACTRMPRAGSLISLRLTKAIRQDGQGLRASAMWAAFPAPLALCDASALQTPGRWEDARRRDVCAPVPVWSGGYTRVCVWVRAGGLCVCVCACVLWDHFSESEIASASLSF